jgi:hypothetical protein
MSRTGNTRSGGTESRQQVAERKGKNQFAQYPDQTAQHRTKKNISLSQVVTESKQKSFSHAAKTETNNRRRLRNSIGGKTNRRCKKGNRGDDTNVDASKSEHERKLNGSQTSTERESKNTRRSSDLTTQDGTTNCNKGFLF